MKCMNCGKEVKPTIGGCYTCEKNCGLSVNDGVYRNYGGSYYGDSCPPTNEIEAQSWKPEQPLNGTADNVTKGVVSPGDWGNADICGQQGWICPKCGAVLSPFQYYCPFCSPKSSKITFGTVTGDFDLNLYTKVISEEEK